MAENLLEQEQLDSAPQVDQSSIPNNVQMLGLNEPIPGMSPIAQNQSQAYTKIKQELDQKPRPSQSSLTYDQALNNLTILANRTNKFAKYDWLDPAVQSYDKSGRKYEGEDYGYRYGLDNDDFYGERQGVFETTWKGGARLGLGIATKVGQGVGFIGGLLNPENWDSNIISNAADNGFTKVFDELDEKTKQDWLPTFQEAADREKGFWSRAFTDGDFWMTDVTDGLAFLVSAWVPGIALSKLGVGVKLAKGLSGLRLGIGAAEAEIEGAAMASNYIAKGNTAFKGLDRFNAWALATASESMFESKGVKDHVMESLTYDEYGGLKRKADGTLYTEDEKKKIAAAAAQNTFLMNAGLLAATNAVELKWFGKMFGKTEGAVAGNLVGGNMFGENLAVRQAVGGIEKFLASKKGAFAKGAFVGIASEGYLEENGQLAIQRVNENYGASGKIATMGNLGQVLEQYGKQTVNATLGRDPEAAASIGIGAILGAPGGGFSSISQRKENQLTTTAAVEAYNSAQQNWLKFGNIYKTQTIKATDENGNLITKETLVLDPQGEPVIDTKKIAGVTSSFQSVNSALEESLSVSDNFKRDLLRNKAFAEFVTAHVNAGIEDTLMNKLDSVTKASPEDVAKLGFLLNEDVTDQVNKYKGIAGAIISQNKLLNSDIIFDTSEADKGRKSRMVELASEQTVYKSLESDLLSETQNISNQLVTSENASLTDGIVQQLNDIKTRIQSQNEVIEDLKSKNNEFDLSIAEDVLKGLEKNLKNLEKDNALSLKEIKTDENGFYKFEKAERNDPKAFEQYNKKAKLRGEIQNYIKTVGFEWAKYADTIDGKNNFLKYIASNIVAPFNKSLEEENSLKQTTELPDMSVKTMTATYTDASGEEQTFEFVTGKQYSLKSDDNTVSTLTIVDVNPDDNIVSVKVNQNPPVELDATELASQIVNEGWEEVIAPEEKKKGKLPIKKSKDSKDFDNGEDEELEDDNTQPTFSSQNKLPKFEEVGFNKTFGRQYLDDEDTVLNKENGTDRFFAFTAKYNLNRRGYALKVVTKDNDEFGIRQSDVNEDDIKVIIVKKVTDDTGAISYSYVDSDNKLIPEGQATADNIIYRSLADIKSWDVERVRNSYSVDEDTTDEAIQTIIDEEKAYQESLVERVKEAPVYLTVQTTSPGTQRIEYTSAINANGKREIAKAQVAGRVTVENPDFTDLRSASNPEANIGLRISTGKGVLLSGVLAGRAVMQEYTYENGKKIWGDKIVRVFNRELSDDEKTTIISAMSRLSEFFIKKYGFGFGKAKKKATVLTKSEQAEYDLVYDYLRGVLNWSKPRKGKVSNKYFWIDSGLHRGNIKIDFKPEAIAKNKERLLANAFHHINNTALQDNSPFTTIKFINKKAVPNVKYKSYEEYLLADRDTDVPPVYTSLPLYDSETPQRSNVYIVWKDPSLTDDSVEEAPKKKTTTSKTASAKEIKGTNKVKGSELDEDIDAFIEGTKQKIQVKNYEITYKPKNGGVVIQLKNTKTFKITESTRFKSQKDIVANRTVILENIAHLTKYTYGTSKSLSPLFEMAQKAMNDFRAGVKTPTVSVSDLEEQKNNEIMTALASALDPEAFLANRELTAEEKAIEENIKKEIDAKYKSLEEQQATTETSSNIYFNIEDAVANAVVENGKMSATVYEKNVETNEVAKLAEFSMPVMGGNLNITKTLLTKALIAQLPSVGDEDAPFRLALDQMTQTEDFAKLRTFMEKNLPMIPVKKMGELIYNKAWGTFLKGAIYIYEKAEIGTGYHEAFEAVWASFLTPEEQGEYAKEFKARTGTFYNPFTKETKNYSDASMYDVREMLAEEFRSYILNAETPSGKIKGFFQTLWDMIKALFNLSPKDKEELDSNINGLFKKIGTGGFKNSRIISEKNVMSPVFRVGNFTQKQSSEVLEGLKYHFFTNLFSKGNNIDSILGTLSKQESNQLLSDLWKESMAQVLDNIAVVSPNLRTAVEAYTQEFYSEFRKSLERYGVMFSEIETAEEDKTDTLGIRDTITVDPRSMTNTNVRLLLASLPQTQVKNGKVVLVKNDFNQPKLVEEDKVHVTLLNELSNIVSIVNQDGQRTNVLDQMFTKLESKYKSGNTYRDGFGWLRNLKLRLKYEDVKGNKIDATTLDRDDMSLRVSFTKSFSNARFQPEKLIISDEGYIYNANPLLNVNEDRIRNGWSNNLKVKIQNKQTDLVKLDANGRMIINRKSQTYRDLMGTLNDIPNFDILTSLNVLDELGIEFTTELPQLIEYQASIREQAMQILNVMKAGEIEDMSDLFGKNVIGGRLSTLISIESKFNSEDNVLSYLNAEGETQYSVNIPSLLSTTVNILNTVKSQKELVQTCPWLGFIDEDDNVVLNAYQTNSELLKAGGILFDKAGRRKRNTDLKYHVISGTGISDVDGANTAKLQFPERIANEIHYLLQNIVFSNINSDKSTEYGITIPGKLLVSSKDIRNMQEFDDTKIIDKYMDQLSDEMSAAMIQFQDPISIQYYQDENTGVYNLGHFRDILGKDLINKFKSEVLSEEPKYENFEDFVEANKAKIQGKIKSYLNDKIAETAEFLKSQDLFVKPAAFASELYITDAIDNETLNTILGLGETQNIRYRTTGRDSENVERSGYTEDDLNNLAGILAINKEILLTEQHKVIYGHPAMYKDLPKRANGATSNKEALVEDSDVVSWMDSNMVRNDGKQRSNDVHQTIKNISFKDMNVASMFYQDIVENTYAQLIQNNLTKQKAESKIGARFDDQGKLTGFIMKNGKFTGSVKAYMNLVEADAMAMGLPDAVRDILFMSGKFNNQAEAQWNYEIAYEKLVRSGSIKKPNGSKITKSNLQYKSYPKAEIESAKEVYEKGDPGFVFQVLKPQYFGYAKTDNVTHPVFLKHSLQPKFYRHVEGTQFEALYLAAQNEQVDIIGFESGQKVGNVTTEENDFLPIYSENGSSNVEIVNNKYTLPEALPRQELYTRFYGIQVEQSSKPKQYVVRGTQVSKIVMTNFFSNGAPINEEIGKLIAEYNDTITKMIKLGKESLLKELGLVRNDDNVYDVNDLSKLVSTLKAEAEKRNLPENIVNAINYIINQDDTQELQYPFDTLINKDKIDNILNSIVDSRVISEKMSGKASVQVASTLYERNPRDYTYLKDGKYVKLTKEAISTLSKDEKASVRMQSSDLKFYRNENGKIAGMEVYISWPFKEVTPEELGLVLENGIYKINGNIDSQLLKGIGFRIPTQAPNSIEAIVIKGFTPSTNGDMIVVPSEIVGKAGSDFDIDKLNIYLPNASVEVADYSSKKFKDFMIADMMSRGQSEKYANDMLNSLSISDIKAINRSTYTEEGRLNKNAPTSLSDISKDKKTLEDYAFFKKGLSRYNAQYKGKKTLMYTPANDTDKEGLQNKLINVMSELILRPENYSQLVAPNTTENLEVLAEVIKKAKVAAGTKLEEDEKSPTYLRTFVGSATIRERYLTAKRMVGIAALHSTLHAIAQVSGLKLNSVFKTSGVKYLMGKDETQRSINIKLSHHPKTEDNLYNIGHITDVNGDTISDLISEALSGFVDGAKNPFVFDLNFSLNTAGTWFYLQHLGVPVDEIAYFFNQPILDSYFTELAKNKSNFKKINGEELIRQDLFYKVIAPYYDKLTGGNLKAKLVSVEDSPAGVQRAMKDMILKELNVVDQSKGSYSLSELKQGVANGSKADAALQISVLMNYLQYESQSRFLGNFMQAISYDTNKTRTTQENMLQVAKWERSASEEFVKNPEAILDNTFLGEMKTQKEDVFNMFKNFFITLSPELQEVFQPLYNKIDDPEYFFTKDDITNLINRYQNHTIAYLLHTTPFVDNDGKTKVMNDLYKEFFTSGGTMAKKLYDYKNSVDPNISDNLVIKELLPLMTDDANKTDNIMLFRNRMDTFQINNVIEALNNLKEYAQETSDKDLLEFTDNLAKFSILQSGLQSSFVDFKKVLSTEIYSELVKTILDKFKADPKIDTEQVWRTFHQNNWTNRSIVPKAPYWLKVKGGSLSINPESSAIVHDFYIKYIKNPKVSKEEYKEMKKNKTVFKAFEPILFQKSDLKDKKGNVLYLPISKLGNGNKMLELYTNPDQESILENNSNQQADVNTKLMMGEYVSAKDLFPEMFKETGTPTKKDKDLTDQIDENEGLDEKDDFTC